VGKDVSDAVGESMTRLGNLSARFETY